MRIPSSVSYTHLDVYKRQVFESIVPEAKNMTDEEATALLRLALTSELQLPQRLHSQCLVQPSGRESQGGS